MIWMSNIPCAALGENSANLHGTNRGDPILLGVWFQFPDLELEFFLRPTVSRPVHLGIGPPFGTLDQILSCSSFFVWQLLFLLSKAPSLTRKRVSSLQCNHSLVRLLTPNNYTLPSHLRLCSLFVASYDSQGLRWRYSNPPPHGIKVKVTLRPTYESASPSWRQLI
jgi:hypothetical protein